MKSLRLFATIVLAVFTYSLQSSQAAFLVWTNSAGGFWSAATNWSPNAVPTAGDSAFITNAGNYTVTINAVATIAKLNLGDTNVTGIQKLAVTAGTFTVTNLSAATNSIVLLSAGTLVTSGASELLGEVNQAGGVWQLNTPLNVSSFIMTNGELRGANCVITNFNWLGGALNSDALGTTVTIPAGGTLTINGATPKSMSYWVAPGRTLVNNGTATWSGAGISANGGATINNTGAMTLNGDFALAYAGSGNGPVFNNSGTLTKASGAGNLSVTSGYFVNSGSANFNTGSLSVNGQFNNSGFMSVANGTVAVVTTTAGSTNTGTIQLSGSSFLDLSSGPFRLEGAVSSPAADHLRFLGATVTVLTTNIVSPSIYQTAGTVYQGTNVAVSLYNQGAGTIYGTVPLVFDTFTMTNGEIRGANCTITNFNWYGGGLNADGAGSNTTTIASGGTLNIGGATGKGLSYWTAPGRTLVNNGTATWSGAGITGQGGATFLNNSALTLNGDFSFVWGGSGNGPVFRNGGTVTLASGADFSMSSAYFDNLPGAAINFNAGSITLFSGCIGTNRGDLNLDATSFFQHQGATLYLAGNVSAPAGNSLRFNGTTTYIATPNLVTPSLWLQAGTVYQATNITVNTYNQQAGAFYPLLPVAVNNYNMTNAELRGANITITNFNWFGGALNADGPGNDTVTIPAGGALNISGAVAKSLSYWTAPGRTLVNSGTAVWSGAGITGQGGATFINNGTLTVAGDFALAWGGAGNGPVLRNYTTMILSNGSDFSLNSAILDNQSSGGIYFNNGSITVGSGSLATNSGVLNLDAGSFFQFSGATLVFGGDITAPTGNSLRFAGTTAYINTTNIATPSLWQQGGTIVQTTNFVVNTFNQQAGTFYGALPLAINNYNMTNAELRGANLTITNFNWFGGSLNSENAGSNTVAVVGNLNIAGATAKYLSDYSAANNGRRLINQSTGTWSGAGITGYYWGKLLNPGTLNFVGDFSLAWGGAGNGPVLNNMGTLNLTSGSDFTLTSANFDNQVGGMINFTVGSITVGSGSLATNSGVLSLDAGSFFQFSGATLVFGGDITAPTGNSLRFAGTTAYINTTNIATPSLWQQGGTIVQTTNFVVNTFNQQAGTFYGALPLAINNYNMTNAELRGANITITNFNWLGGSLNSENAGSNTVTVVSNLNIAGATSKYLSDYSAANNGRRLINQSTGSWSGAGITGYYWGKLLNPGTLNLVGDFSLVWGGAGNGPVLNNTGTLNLSGGSDFTLTSANFDNQVGGVINFTGGSITVGAGSYGTNSGSLNLDATSLLQFSGVAFVLGGEVTAPTGNSLRFAGTTSYINTTNIATPSLWQQGGTIVQTTNFVVNTFNQQAGTFYGALPLAINNFNMTNAELRGANLTITNFNWFGGSLNSENAGSNTVTIPVGGTLNISGATGKSIGDYAGTTSGGRRLVNNGTAAWSGAGITAYWGAQIINNNAWMLGGDFSLAWGGGGNGPTFRNTSLLTLSNGSDFTLSSAVFENQLGATASFTNGSITIGSGSLATNGGSMKLDAGSFFQFSGATFVLGGDVTAPSGNSLRFAGTTAYVMTTNITTPSVWQQGGTIVQATNFVVNTFNQQAGTLYGALPLNFNNYNMTNAELRGANCVITNFNWLGGSLNSENAGSNTTTIPAGGTLNISGAVGKGIGDYSSSNQGRRLVNRGIGTWSGAGITGYWGAIFSNLNTLTMTNDSGFAWGGGGSALVFQNNGVFTKSGGTGAASFSTVVITNSGLFSINSGGFSLTGGDFTQGSGSSSLGTNFLCGANVRVLGGSFAGRGSISGTFVNNALSSAGAPLGLVVGTSWTNAASGTIRFELGGTNPGTNFDQFRLSGPAIVNGTADLALANGFVPVPGNTFTCIVASARSGVFTNLTFSGGYEFSALYTPTSVVFRAENALPTVNLTVLNGNTQLVCTPFKLLATASDVGGAVTNLSILQDGVTIANANGGSTTGAGESDFPLDITFVAQAIDDQGGKSYATQTVSMTTSPLHVLQLGGKRPNGAFKFCMVGELGSNYMVLAATNIAEPSANWAQLGLMENTNGIWRYYDNGTLTNRPYRFYRAMQTPAILGQ